MQRFGRAGRDFSLQAVAILLAEPTWFLEDHQKRLVQKRKRRLRSQKGGKKASSARTDTGTRTNDVSSSDNEPDSEGDNSMNAGNKDDDNLNGDREGTSDVEEAIKSFNIMAGGTVKGCKRTTDEVMRLFINAHLLRGRKRCRRFHSNHHYRTADIRRSFVLDPRHCFANPSFSAEPPPCCNRCKPKAPSICCDLCHMDLVHTMIDDRDDNYHAPPRGSNCPKWPESDLTQRASQFCDALYDWRTETATDLFGALDFYPADLFLPEDILEDIVAFVDAHKINTLQDLQKKTSWILCDRYGDQIISLIHRFFPPVPLPNLLTSMPLPPRTHKKGPTRVSNVLSSSPRPSSSSDGIRKPRAPPTCTVCFQKGHKSTYTISFSSTKS